MRVSTTTVQNAFGKYLKLALDDIEIIITKNGHAIAKLEKLSDDVIMEERAKYYAEKKMSYKQFMTMNEKSDLRYEYIDGEVYMLASPSFEHQKTITALLIDFSNYLKDSSCNIYTAPLDITLKHQMTDTNNIVQPDLMVICDGDHVENGRYLGVPELVIEILSPSTRSKDMIKKLDLYMSSGIKEYWIIDLDQKQVHVYSFKDYSLEHMISYKENDTLTSTLFSDFTIDTQQIMV